MNSGKTVIINNQAPPPVYMGPPNGNYEKTTRTMTSGMNNNMIMSANAVEMQGNQGYYGGMNANVNMGGMNGNVNMGGMNADVNMGGMNGNVNMGANGNVSMGVNGNGGMNVGMGYNNVSMNVKDTSMDVNVRF